MTLDSKTIQINQKIEQERQDLLKKLLEERFGSATRQNPKSEDQTFFLSQLQHEFNVIP